jgi:hypothetical protein
MPRLALALLLLFAIALPASGASPHLGPGALVADGDDRAALVLLYVQGGYGDAQSVYVVRPVARCHDSDGPGWYGLPSARELRSAAVLEGQQRLGTLDPGVLPNACATLGPAPLKPARATAWDRLLDGDLPPFAPLAFPPFVSP